jgi:pimeloyl-ACP methyl ester carboxylesterase
MKEVMRRVLLVLALFVVGCGGSHPKPPAAAPPTTTTAAPEPVLTDPTECSSFKDAECSVLRVPVDRSHPGAGSLELRVAVAGRRSDPVFLVLSGGPGEAGLFLIKTARRWLGPVANQVRLVAFDQRGTGRDALQCPALQKAMGASDLTPPPPQAVKACAAAVGDQRRFFTTRDTVEDLEDLRVALKADTMALDGTSYGTFVAQRYALAHPERVSALVLDSVVPSEGASLLSEVSMKATARVLGPRTTAQLAKVVSEQHNGPALLDMLTGLSVGAPRGTEAAEAIAAAAGGNVQPLNGLIAGVRGVMQSWDAERLSQGLHASTLCADTPAPWGSAAAPLAGRRAALERAASRIDPYPYDRATLTGNGFAQQCLNWPPVDVPEPGAAGRLPDVPTLLLGGDRDLSTPLEWTQSAAEFAPQAKLIVAHGAGHGVQSQDVPEAIRALRRLVASLG